MKDDALNILLKAHVIEGLYRDSRLASGLGAQSWFLKTVVVGSLALLTLETHIRRVHRLRSIR